MFLRYWALALTLILLLAAAGCGGGNGGDEIRIVKINLNPAAASAGSIVELSASISAPGQSVSSLVKEWEVSAGSLSLAPPDFSMLMRGTSKAASETTSSTTNSIVYWMVPATTGPATISLTVGTDTEETTVQVVSSPMVLSVTDGAGGSKVCTVSAQGVNDLYQAAFRVNFTSAWTVASVEQGGFLGDENETLFIGLDDQSGFVPVAITKRGDVAGEDGSGVLATITFDPVETSSGVSAVADVPFALDAAILRTSGNQPLPGSE
ncbi:MAG TPA: hypothetical protein ENO21_01915 [Firmicutes bacterium]|nr:hypothetical protein [Bacillota bacterium]